MALYLLLLVFALLASSGNCSQEAPEVVYISKSFEGSRTPCSVVYHPLEGVINYRDANANEGSCRVQSDGLYPSVSCKCSRGKCGLLLYDGYSFLHSQTGDFQKEIYHKGVALVFYNPADSTVLPKLKEAVPNILSNEIHLPYFPLRNNSDKGPLRNSRVLAQHLEMFRQADQALQVSLSASLDIPRCYVAFIDPPRSAHYVSALRHSPLPLRTTSDSANVVYMSAHPPAPESLHLEYSPQQRSITFEYNHQDDQRVSSVLSIGHWNRHLRIRAQNRFISTFIFLDRKEKSYTGNKRLDGRRNVMIAYRPESGTNSQTLIAYAVEEVFMAAGLFDSWEVDVETFKRLDAEVQRIIAKYNPSHPRGYLVIIDPAPSSCPSTADPNQAPMTQSVTDSSAGVQSQLSSAGSLTARLSSCPRHVSGGFSSTGTSNVHAIASVTGDSTTQPEVPQQTITVPVVSHPGSEVRDTEDDAITDFAPGDHYALEDDDITDFAPGDHYALDDIAAPSNCNEEQSQQSKGAPLETTFQYATINIGGRATLSIPHDSTMTLQSKSTPEDRVNIFISENLSTALSGQGKSLIFYPGQDFKPLGAATITPSTPCAFVLLWFGVDFSPKHLELLHGINPKISAPQMRDLLEDFIEDDGISCPLVLIKITLSTKN